MAINLKFDLTGNPEPPSIILANRNGNKLGQLNVNVESIDVSDKFNAASEFSFTLNKYIDDKPTPLWDKVVDFKLVYCPEWDLWFEIKVELDETTETVKTVFCTQLGQAELSQIKVYNIHINEEGDPNWDMNNETYKSTILYDKEHTDASLLHRLLKDKAPHYSIAYVDESIQRIQKTFSFDDTSICDAFDEIEEEIGCLFVYNSNSTKGGKPSRTISVYDLQQNCNDCGHRGEFTDKCPKCESTNIKYGYGEDTLIFVTSDELATEGIQLVTDTDSVKNCFKLEGGDDLMTATIRNCNPNGSDYIWYFSDALKEDMSKELVEKIESYDEKYQDYYNNHISELNEDIVNQYNKLVEDFDEDGNLIGGYSRFYNTKSTCLNCGHEDYFEEQCPKCNSKNILAGKKLQTMPTKIDGYPNLMTAYYNTIDLLLYLESGLMPNVDIETNKTTAEKQIELLTSSTLSPVAVNVKEVKNITDTTAKSAVLSMAKILVKSTYKVDVVDGSSSLDETIYTDDTIGEYKKWTGKFVVTNYSDEKDSATSELIEVFIGNNAKTFVEQKIDKALNKENTDDYSITGLFAKEYDDFCIEIKKYALNPLDNFSRACDAAISILTEQGVGNDGSNEDDEFDKATKKALYDALYKPYFDKQQAINDEIKIRENEIAIIEGIWDKSDENNPKCTTNGLQQYIEKCQQDIQEALDFEKHLENLWLEFCAYRREDKYSNSNYVSDGLNNAELFERANEFIEVAEEEIFKSAELQHSISATLNNLLSLPKFKPLLKSFKTGNWIRVQVDDRVYKLRLLEYGFGYGDSESISVEFSDVTKIKNGVTDVKEVLEQASSMASSYDSVQRQAEKGNVARSTIDQWLVDGLNAANMQITSNDSEEVLLTKSGLLARSYDDITGTYSPEQLKITHNIMAYTDDNWKTVRQSIGKHEYNYFNEDKGELDKKTGYGMNADFLNSGVVNSSQIIGGNIYSNNFSGSIDKETGEIISNDGSYIDLEEGKFSLAGGKLTYNGDDLTVVGKIEVTTAGKIGCWDINETSIYANNNDISDEDLKKDKELNNFYQDNKMYFGVQGLSLGDKFKVEPNGIATMTNANVSGTITGSQIVGSNYLLIGSTIETKDENGYITYKEDENGKFVKIDRNGKLTCNDIDILDGTLKTGRYILENEDGTPQLDETTGEQLYGWHTWIDENGILKANESVINGTVYAIAGEIGGCEIKDGKLIVDTIQSVDYSDSGSLNATSLNFVLNEDNESYSVSNGTTNIYMLKIPSIYNDKPVTSVADRGFQGRSLMLSVIIPSNIISLNQYAFDICTALETVDFAENSQLTTIGEYAFRQCYALSSVNIPENVTTIKDYAFYYCNHLKAIKFGNSIETIGDFAFAYCNSATSPLVLPKTTTSIGDNAFIQCNGLTQVKIGDSTATDIKIPDDAIGIGNDAFSNCNNIVDLEIGNSIRSIGQDSFYNCQKLKHIVIPNSVKTIGSDAFRLCMSSSTSSDESSRVIVIGEGVQSIEQNAFSHCTYATDIIYNATECNASSSGIFDMVGSKSENGVRITIGSNVTCIPDGLFYSYYNSDIKSVVFADNSSCTHIGNNAFENIDLTNLIIPDSVEYIGNSAFAYCYDLTQVKIGDKTKTIDVSAFYNCSVLESIIIPASVETIGDSAFFGCSNLKHVYYKGTQEQWNALTTNIGASNNCLIGAEIHYEATNDALEFTIVEPCEIPAPQDLSLEDVLMHVNGGFKISSIGDYMIDSPKFKVTKDGIVSATAGEIGGCLIQNGRLIVPAANISGTLTAGSVSANNITAGTISAGNGVRIDGGCIITGTLSFDNAVGKNVDLTGTINATKGTVGNFTLTNGNLYGFDNNIIIRSESEIGGYIAVVSDEYNLQTVISGASMTTDHVLSTTAIIAGLDMQSYKITRYGSNNACFNFFESGIAYTAGSDGVGFYPTTYTDIGTSLHPWAKGYIDTLYTLDGSVRTSDRNKKNTIEYFDLKQNKNAYRQIFDTLKPVAFKLNKGTSDRTHIGLIAQDVEQAVLDAGLTTQDFAAICYDIDEETGEKKNYGIRYEELVSMCIYEIQKLKKRADEFDNQLKTLENK